MKTVWGYFHLFAKGLRVIVGLLPAIVSKEYRSPAVSKREKAGIPLSSAMRMQKKKCLRYVQIYRLLCAACAQFVDRIAF